MKLEVASGCFLTKCQRDCEHLDTLERQYIILSISDASFFMCNVPVLSMSCPCSIHPISGHNRL